MHNTNPIYEGCTQELPLMLQHVLTLHIPSTYEKILLNQLITGSHKLKKGVFDFFNFDPSGIDLLCQMRTIKQLETPISLH